MTSTFDSVYTTLSRKPPLKAIVVSTSLDPTAIESILGRRRKLKRAYRGQVLELESNLFNLSLQKGIRSKVARGQAIVDSSKEGLWILFTDEPNYYVKHVLSPFLNGLYPDVSRAYLNYRQILNFLAFLRETYTGSTVLTSIAVKRQKRSGNGGKKGTLLLWEEEGSEDELRQHAQKYRLWIDQLGYEIRDKSDLRLLVGSITGTGIARLRYGSFQDFMQHIVGPLSAMASDWRAFYSRRERKLVNGIVQLSPYAVRYPFALEDGQIAQISRELANFYSFAVVHSGNPYFAASLSDSSDGSSFGLTILRDAVTITPISKASPSALWELTNRIQSIIGEGQIESIHSGAP